MTSLIPEMDKVQLRRGCCSSPSSSQSSRGWRGEQWLTVAALEIGVIELTEFAQKFSDETGLSISVCHFPPGTSKWNKVEHRLFSFISSNWRGEPLRDYETIVNLISRTTTAKGLQVTCRLDRRKYPTGRKVTDEEIKRVNLKRNTFHGDWNYTIHPSTR